MSEWQRYDGVPCVECDHCKTEFDGEVVWSELTDELLDEARDSGWIIDGNVQLCQDCHRSPPVTGNGPSLTATDLAGVRNALRATQLERIVVDLVEGLRATAAGKPGASSGRLLIDTADRAEARLREVTGNE